MSGYVDLALSDDEVQKQYASNTVMADAPKYPYGLSISLDEKTLSKLDLDHSDWDVGDVFPVDVLLKVMGKNINESQDGEKCCINMQIIAMKGEEEPEDEEEEEFEDGSKVVSEGGYLKYKSS